MKKKQHIVVIGANFAGFTAAIELKQRLGTRHDVTVISKTDQFLFAPALVSVPFGLRTREEITFPIRVPLEEHGIRFRQDVVGRIDLDGHKVVTKGGDEHYDFLVIATGPKPNYGAIPGLGPRGYTHSIMSLADAEGAATAFQSFLRAPGPVIVGGVQGASCLGAAIEFTCMMAHRLRELGLSERAPLTYLTADASPSEERGGDWSSEDRLAKYLFEQLKIEAITGAAIQQISPAAIVLSDGRVLPFSYAMLIPALIGVDAVRACVKITNASGFVRVNEFYQTDAYSEVFAAGLAVAADAPEAASVLCDGARRGHRSEQTAKLVAHNIVAQIDGEEPLPIHAGLGECAWV